MHAGYYLVRDSDNSRFYICKKVSERELQKICASVLSDKQGWGYWIDYCLGLDIAGRPAWVNIDQTDLFI